MKMLDINNMSQEELRNELDDLQESYSNLQFQKATHQLDNPVQLKYLRRDIARLKTVLHEYETGLRQPKNKTTE